ncbi:MAG: DUF3800 domain-containing protein [Actinobacteria bacterium]|nr:DUF3800 domain-containing protein [Actinomycetota bacterium]MCG2819133.1 DUF3800 domain-containing protein [Actinomycetes bacterium]MBU4218740.1 DUF3800 domain-containing protein [Actinomycetota bacterium]MBU4359469.1 DUF3800 domain-containing protein [Actinomycetota bacterium]MBU4391340.1 DUF3800 domain-containing protein [Actinomycetota bacterium]
MKVLFLDESGDHNLLAIDPQYPIFVLGGVILDKEYAEGELTRRMNIFKQKLFGTEDVILHTADITRNRSGFERMKEPAFREYFYEELNELMSGLDYRVVACAIRKDEHLAKYGLSALDPYMLSFDILVERLCFEVGRVSRGGLIVAEERDPTLDRELELAYLNLKIQGTRYIKAKDIIDRIAGLVLRSKSENVAGLQLADLVVTPIGRHVLGKRDKEDWRIVEKKLRRSRDGRVEGAGLVILPR